jgi:hypothetical protein
MDYKVYMKQRALVLNQMRLLDTEGGAAVLVAGAAATLVFVCDDLKMSLEEMQAEVTKHYDLLQQMTKLAREGEKGERGLRLLETPEE